MPSYRGYACVIESILMSCGGHAFVLRQAIIDFSTRVPALWRRLDFPTRVMLREKRISDFLI